MQPSVGPKDRGNDFGAPQINVGRAKTETSLRNRETVSGKVNLVRRLSFATSERGSGPSAMHRSMSLGNLPATYEPHPYSFRSRIEANFRGGDILISEIFPMEFQERQQELSIVVKRLVSTLTC
jgi:hypothetical protein